MNRPAERSVKKAVDSIQERLTSYACDLNYDALTPEAIHISKVRVIDTLGALVAGFFGEPCHIVRNLAAQMPNPGGATIIGTRNKTTPDMAAFVNSIAARYAEMTDSYHWPGSFHGHASDALPSVLAAAEHVQASGRDFIVGVALAYEVFCRFSDVFHNRGFDNTNFATIAVAVAAGKLFALSPDQLAHAISMAVVPNVILKQVRTDQKSMFKGAAGGHAGRAGMFAVMLARAGMEGPHLPFEGKAGWCEHVAGERFSLDTWGGNGTRFKVLDPMIKNRPTNGGTIPSLLAAEKVAPLKNLKDVKQIVVEVNKHTKQFAGAGGDHYHPDTREDADHSIPYNVAVALMDGTVTLRSYSAAYLSNPELLALMQKIEIVENDEFTAAFQHIPVVHLSRVTVTTASGEKLVGEAGDDEDDMGRPKSDAQIEQKFRGLTEDVMSTRQVNTILDRLWHLEEIANVAEIPPAFLLV